MGFKSEGQASVLRVPCWSKLLHIDQLTIKVKGKQNAIDVAAITLQP